MIGPAAAAAAGRRYAEAGMTDTCLITYASGVHTDPLTGQVTEQRITRYSGRCRMQQAQPQGRRVAVGQVPVVVLELQLQLPVTGTEQVAAGDQVVITASGDAGLLGRTWRVRDLTHKSHLTSRRLMLEEIT